MEMINVVGFPYSSVPNCRVPIRFSTALHVYIRVIRRWAIQGLVRDYVTARVVLLQPRYYSQAIDHKSATKMENFA
jgi:hypothetical protein